MFKVKCIKTNKDSWLKIGMILTVEFEDAVGRYYFNNGGVASKRLFKFI